MKAYCYGMVAPSTLLLLDMPYPSANAYAEIKETLDNLAGEAVAGAWVLQRLGIPSQIDGRWLADSDQARKLLQTLNQAGLDTHRLEIKPGFHPMEEYVISDGKTRTVFGGYIKILFTQVQWNFPDEKDIACSNIALVDPFLGEASKGCALLCEKHQVPFVTCDVEPDNLIAEKAEACIISEEFLLREGAKILGDRFLGIGDKSWKLLFDEYCQHCKGWVIFTFGGHPIWFREPGTTELQYHQPREINVLDSTGAGDSFRAGFAYAIAKGYLGNKAIQVASSVAELVCERFPGVLNSPTQEEIMVLLEA